MVTLGKTASAVKAVMLSLVKAEEGSKGSVTLTTPVLAEVTGKGEWWVRKAAWVAKTNGSLVKWNKAGVTLTPEGREFVAKMGHDDASWAALKGTELYKSETPEGQAEMAAKRKAASEKRKGQPTVTQQRLTAVEDRITAIETGIAAILERLPAPKAKGKAEKGAAVTA